MAENTKRVKWYDRQKVDLTDMQVEQSYNNNRIGNIFNRLFGDGVISGLIVSDDSSMLSQTEQDSFYDTLLDSSGNQIIQIFKATTNNIQKITLYGRDVGANGNIVLSVYELSDPSDASSEISNNLVGQLSRPHGDFAAAFGEVTFDFSSVNSISDSGSLTVGNYYALVIERDNIVGSIDISYNTANPYSDGHIREYVFSTDTYTTRDTWDLYIKINTAAIQISSGYAYNSGDPIEVSTVQRNISLLDTSGTTNYIVIKYLQVDTDLETHPRTGLQAVSYTHLTLPTN